MFLVCSGPQSTAFHDLKSYKTEPVDETKIKPSGSPPAMEHVPDSSLKLTFY